MGDYRFQLNVVGWALCSIATVVVGARSYCRHFLLHSFGIDDALMVLAMVGLILGFCILSSPKLGDWHCNDGPGFSGRVPRLRPAP